MGTREHIDTGVWTRNAKRRAWVCAIGAAMVGASVPALGDGSSMVRDSIGEVLSHVFPGARGRGCFFPRERGTAWEEQGEWKCVLTYGDGDDAQSAAFAHIKQVGATDHMFSFWERDFRRGVWAITTSESTAWIDVDGYSVWWNSNSLPVATGLGVRTAMAARMRAVDKYDIEALYPGIVATGSWKTSSPIWSGWLINACTIAGLAMLACTVRGVVRDVNRHARAVKLLREHCCGWCGYDVRGLAPGTRICPECGRALREAPPG